MAEVTNSLLEGAESVYNYIHGNYRGFNTQGLESRGRIKDKGTKRIATQVSNMIQKVPETVIHLKLDGEQWRGYKKGLRRLRRNNGHEYVSKCTTTTTRVLLSSNSKLVNESFANGLK